MSHRTNVSRLTPDEAIEQALRRYQLALAQLASITRCPSWWPPDEDTRCDLVDGHNGPHRHKPSGLSVGVITWDRQ